MQVLRTQSTRAFPKSIQAMRRIWARNRREKAPSKDLSQFAIEALLLYAAL